MDKDTLRGLRVIDFSRVLAGPYTTRILADYGAEVIKVQSKKTATGSEANDSAYFKRWNRNKRSVTLDMERKESRGLLLRLVSECDLFVENFSPRVMPNWGLDYPTLKRNNPKLIMLSMSAMGQTGPWKDFVGFGPTIQSLAGLTYLTSYSPEMPVGLGFSYADVIAGLYGALAVLAALEFRELTGEGQHIDLSEYEAMCTALGPTLMDSYHNKRQILPSGNRPDHLPASPYGCYRCMGNDRWCVIAVFNEEEWHTLCRIMGQPEWTKGENFSTLSRRSQRRDELDRLIEKWTMKHHAEEVVRLLQEAGVPAGVVQGPEQLLKDPHLMARRFLVIQGDPRARGAVLDTYPMKSNRGEPVPVTPSPSLGEDNYDVFGGILGIPEEMVSKYIEEGIIG